MDWTGSTAKKDDHTVQGSEAWKAFRGKGIGSSDISVILGISPWKNIHALWLEKTGQVKDEFKGNWATERGTRLEPTVRAMYEEKTGLKFPDGIATHKEYEIFRASFDGINHDIKKVIEIKCPSQASHQKALLGQVPEVYIPQVQWLLMVSGYDDLDYISWDGETSLAIVPVKADKEYQQKLRDNALKFWECVTTMVSPIAIMDEEKIVNEELENLLIQRHNIKKEIDALTIGLDSLTDKIKEMSKGESFKLGAFDVKWSESKGAIDYSKIPELMNVDLEPYRKPNFKKFLIKNKDDK